jgi:uncharacterized protein (DUF2267 family)
VASVSSIAAALTVFSIPRSNRSTYSTRAASNPEPSAIDTPDPQPASTTTTTTTLTQDAETQHGHHAEHAVRALHTLPSGNRNGEGAMSDRGLDAFDRTVQLTYAWLDEPMGELGTDNRQRAWYALTSRDRLPIDEAAHLAAELPLLVRGMHYDGWRPAEAPVRGGKHAFAEELERRFQQDGPGEAERAAAAVSRLLSRRVTPCEVEDVIHVLPAEVRAMWQQAVAA